MAIDFSRKGWLPRKCKKTPGELEIYIERSIPLHKKSLDETVEFSVQRLKNEFPNFKIEIQHIRKLFSRSIEITGKSFRTYEEGVFWIKFTSKKIYAKIHGLDPDSVMNCLM